MIKTGPYCAVTGEDGSHSELLLTRRYEVGAGTASWPLAIADNLFWGQGDLYRTISNLTITYECFFSPDGRSLGSPR